MAAYFVVGDGIWLKFKLNQAFIVILVTCENEEDQSKNKCMSYCYAIHESPPELKEPPLPQPTRGIDDHCMCMTNLPVHYTCNMTNNRRINVLTVKLLPEVEDVCKDKLFGCMLSYVPFA